MKHIQLVKCIYQCSLVVTPIFLLAVLACRPQVVDRRGIANEKDTYTRSFSFSPLDSLEKYSHSANKQIELDNPRTTFFVDTINGVITGAITQNDSTIAVFKKDRSHWHETSRGFVNYVVTGLYIRAEDLNNDRSKDLRIDYSGASGSAYISSVFIFDTARKIFIYNDSYSLPQMEYDSVQNLIRSSCNRGAFEFTKAIYKIHGDGLELLKEVDMAAYGETGTIWFYRLRRGKKVLFKTERMSVETIQNRFDTLLWKNRNQ